MVDCNQILNSRFSPSFLAAKYGCLPLHGIAGVSVRAFSTVEEMNKMNDEILRFFHSNSNNFC